MLNTAPHIKQILSMLPEKPGVYQYLNKEKEIIFPPKKKLLKMSNLQALFHYTAFFHPKMRKNTVNYKFNIPGLGRRT